MSYVETIAGTYDFYRGRTLGLLDEIEKMPDAQQVLLWRPAAGRAHIGWQLMHIGITEEIFATERLAPHKQGAWTDHWPQFRGGSTPDEDVPEPAFIRELLGKSREHLMATLGEYTDDRLEEIPAALKARNLTVRNVLSIIPWHEAHHQGQAHLTLNLYKNR